MTAKKGFKENIKSLEKILSWFESQDSIDLEEGLAQVKEGTKLLALCKERLKEAENEFQAVKRELDTLA